MKVAVPLAPSELLLAANVGIMRHIQDTKKGLRDAHGAKSEKNGWQLHITGAIGELVVAKHLGLYWNGAIGNLDADDVGPYQVRTRLAGYRDIHLLLHRNDPPDRPFFLVSGSGLAYNIHGWIMGGEGQNEKFWGDPYNTNRPAFWVPEGVLQDCTDFHPLTEDSLA